MIYIDLFLTFLKIGCVSIGGIGSIAVIVSETTKQKWLTAEQIVDMVAISEVTPGPLAVNLATYVGAMKAGFPGAIVATLGEILPAFIIIFIVSIVFTKFIENKFVKDAFSVIRPGVTGVVTFVGLSLVCQNIFHLQNAFGAESYRELKGVMENTGILGHIKEIVILIGILLVANLYKRAFHKKISTIKLLLVGGILGIIANIVIK